ncbi:MAG: hypothetical protein AB7P20_28065, partial [Rhizobiaceae bacterium]
MNRGVADIAAICRQNDRQLDSLNFPSRLSLTDGVFHGSIGAVAGTELVGVAKSPARLLSGDTDMTNDQK